MTTEVLPPGHPFAGLKHKHYQCITADPPWSWTSWSKKNQTRAAENHYQVMDLEAIKQLPVVDLASDNCVLFLWAINSMLPQALEVMSSWGFEFKTVAFTWAKCIKDPKLFPVWSIKPWFLGMGYWTRQNSEQVLLGVRGKPKRISANVRQLVVTHRREHSRKPDRIAESIEQLVAGPYVELFARESRPGWDSWGIEKTKFDNERKAA